MAIDWRRFKKTWHPPDMSGAEQLFDEIGAERFPGEEVADLRDKKLLVLYHDLLAGTPVL